jgi:hypothetical protein
MALLQKRLAFTPVDLTEEVIYTVPSATTTIIKQIMLCNTHNAAVTIHLSVTGSGASSTTAADRILHSFSIASNETTMIAMSFVMEAGEKLWASASSDDVVNIAVAGIEES